MSENDSLVFCVKIKDYHVVLVPSLKNSGANVLTLNLLTEQFISLAWCVRQSIYLRPWHQTLSLFRFKHFRPTIILINGKLLNTHFRSFYASQSP